MLAPLKTFICYAHEDHSTVLGLLKHLKVFEKQHLLELWFDGQIFAGQDWDKSIKNRLAISDLILLFISVDFLTSDYIENIELQTALQRHRNGEATLIPIIVRSCDWQNYFEIGKFQALPEKALPIMSKHFPYIDEAYYEIAQGIKRTIREIQDQWVATLAAKELERKASQKAASKKIKVERLRQKDETAWKAATEEDEINAYEVYIEKYTLYVAEAKKRIDELTAIELKLEAAARRNTKNRTLRMRAATLKNGQEERDFLKAPEMVFLEGGSFEMGSSEHDAEMPIHEVDLLAFWIGKHPITFDNYDFFCNETNRIKPSDAGWGRGRRPVINISWHDAEAYCQWLCEKTGNFYRLPSESEWEYAARGGIASNGFRYSGSNLLSNVAWYKQNSNQKTQLVGKKNANEAGLHDMNGNVWEWCSDKWHESHEGAPTDGSERLSEKQSINRVCRGGAWNFNFDHNFRVSSRKFYTPNGQSCNIGFRVVQGEYY